MRIITVVILMVTLFASTGCSCTSCEKKGNHFNIPEKVVNKSERFVKNKVGEDFFSKYISFNYEKSRLLGDGYIIYMSFRDLDRTWIDEEIYFMTDSKGNVNTDKAVVGIPYCEEAENCKFDVTPEEAEKIAKDYKLVEGIKEWDKSFRWSAEFKQYVWHVLVTISESGSEDNYKAKGEELIINPVNGDIIKHRQWNIR